MTAKTFCNSFAEKCGVYEPENICQSYIIALGVNDIINQGQEIGTIDDIGKSGCFDNGESFAGYLGQIIKALRTKQPKAKVFLMTMPKEDESTNVLRKKHAELLCDITKMYEGTYVIDLFEYAPVFDEEFRRNFFLDGHMNASGYILIAKMVMSYIDYIVRNNPEDFTQVGFIGKGVYNIGAKW